MKEEKKLEKVEQEYQEAVHAEEITETKVEEQKKPIVEHKKEHTHPKINDQ